MEIKFLGRRRNMRKSWKHFCLMTLLSSSLMLMLGLGLISRSDAVVPKDPFLGIPPQVEMYYKVSSDTIKCKDGSKTFSKAQLNDDYCDCPDGSDEPGTSACPQGKFYCRNVGHAPVQLFSSRVNDGICDCCDGSDEYSGEVKCPNMCWEAGKVHRDKVKKKIATYKEGVTLRKRDVEQAKLQFVKDEAELSKLKKEESILKGLVQQLKVRKEHVDKAEEEERLRKEKEEKEKKADEEKTEKEEQSLGSDHDDIVGTLDDPHPDQGEDVGHLDSKAENEFADDSKLNMSPPNEWKQEETKEEKESSLPHNQDNSVVPSEADQTTLTEVSPDPSAKGEDDPSENTKELSKEELGRLVASRWTGNTEKQSTGEHDANANDHENQEHEEIPYDTHDDEYDGYASETDDDTGKYDDADVEEDIDDTYGDDNHNNDAASSYKSDSDEEEDFSDITSPSNPSWLEKIQQTVRNILQKVNLFQTPVDLSDAARVRKEYEESSSKLSKIQSRISSLTQKLSHDFGVAKEFYLFYDKCFEANQNKYVYKICPFKQASQIEGHSTTRLGKWEKFEDSYSVMIFSNGDKCWNGPDRSLKVKLRCGLKNEVTDVDELSRCEYLALLSTPALCLDEKLKELEDKLESMNKERPNGHDEL